MTDTASEDNDTDFFDIAVAHGLLDRDRVNEISDHASQADMHPSDAALSLSAMKPWEVDATRLLMNAKELAPGFELTGLIGCGAAGMVFRAHQSALNRDVALKTINILGRGANATGESRIQQEAQAIARLQHPNIVTAYDSGFYKGRFCIAMELVEGETLADFIERESPISEKVAWEIIRQAAAALCHADRLGIIHRDIKPANLLLCDPPAGTSLPAGVPFVKVVDFGLALDEFRDEDERLTVTGATLGTPAYVAPEQLENSSVDCRADIYALGATAFHLLTGAAPFSGQSPMQSILQKSLGDSSWRDSIPETVASSSVTLMRKMTEADPEGRIASYSTLLQSIGDVLGGVPGNALQSEAPQPISSAAVSTAAQPTRSLRTAAVIAVAVVVAFICWRAINQSASDTGNDPPAVPEMTWIHAGPSTPLFNGTSVPFRLVTPGSQWCPEEAPDGSRILVGTERSSLRIPLRAMDGNLNALLAVNVYLPEANAQVEIEVTTQSPEGKPVSAGKLNIADGMAEFIEKPEDGPSTFEFKKVDPAEVIPHSVEVRREGTRLRMVLKGESVFDSTIGEENQCFVTFRCSKGRIGLLDMDLTALAPARTE